MSIRMTMERPFPSGKTPSHARRHRLVLFFAAALLCLSAGCAQKQAAPLAQAPRPAPQQQQKGDDIVAAARQHIGAPYRFGGSSPESGFDCSGFVSWTYGQMGIKLPRRASEQVAFGEPVRSRDELAPGDIVAFKGTRSRTGWHSGIYTGNGKFIHSPNKGKTVTEDSLDDAYYAKRYYGACRIPRDGGADELYAAYQKRLSEQAGAARAAKGKSGKSANTLALKQNAKKAKAPEKTAQKAKAQGKQSQKATAQAGQNKAPAKKPAAATAAANSPKTQSSPGQSSPDQSSPEKKS